MSSASTQAKPEARDADLKGERDGSVKKC